MATATIVSAGESVNYTPGSDVAKGDIVLQGTLLGIANAAIAANELGSLLVEGVVYLPKAAATTTTVGQKLYYDSTATAIVTSTSSGMTSAPYCAKALEAATTAATTVLVRLSPCG